MGTTTWQATKWVGQKADLEAATQIANHFQFHPVVARILSGRGYTTLETVEHFLSADRTKLLDPYLLHDMKRAVDRIRIAVENREKILIFGDYDVDGTAATAIMVRALRFLGVEPLWFVPSRFKHGYGLHPEVIRAAAEDGITLVISVDTGISGFEALAVAKENGLDVVVTDHHEIGKIPSAYAIVHPAFPRSMYSFPSLCGAGVAFKVAQALLGRFPEELLDYVALATIADQVPLTGENRILVREGMNRMNLRKSVAIEALLEVSGVQGRVSSGDIAFRLAPRINACGRLGSAERAVELFLTDDREEAYTIARELTAYNQRRQQIQGQVEQEALAQIESHPHWINEPGIVVSGDWHEGVIGIVAGHLTEMYHKPTLCISVNEGKAKGSGRSTEYIDLYRVLTDVQEERNVFLKYGGHQAAAGFSLNSTELESLRQAFWSVLERYRFEDVDMDPSIKCDSALLMSEVSFQLFDQLRTLEPFGQGNPEPVLYIREAMLEQVQTIGATNQHLKLWIRGANWHSYPVLAFGRGEEADKWIEGETYQFLVTLQENVWNAKRSLQMSLVDARGSR